MLKADEDKTSENLQKKIAIITRSWDEIETNLDMYREKIAENFFQLHPLRTQMFKSFSDDENKDKEDAAEMQKKLFKHSVAIINWMEIIVDFVNGNEETKPILFLLGKQHKRALVNEKMFLELKASICQVLEQSMGAEISNSWELVIEYIYVTYVFPGMEMIETI